MQQRSEETRSKLLGVAEKIFAQQGYDAAGVNDICAAAGVSKGAFYHHFPTKLALFQALLEDWLVQLDAQLDYSLSNTQNASAALLSMASGMGPVFEATSTRTRIILEFWIQSGRQPDLWKSAVAPYHRYLERFAVLLSESGPDSPDPQSQARIVLAMAMGLLLQSFFDPSGADWKDLSVQSMQILINGLEKRQS